jgi:hypothetical protein
LLKRLTDNEKALTEARKIISQSVKDNRPITPAEEWFLDNFYLVEEQIRTARRHLPKMYSRELPHLAEEPSTNLPRVYDIALEMISHGDGRVDAKALGLFVSSYQTVTVLKLGELWAIPIMLRLALIENIRRIAIRIAMDRKNRNLADYWAGRMTITAQKDPKNLFLEIADMARTNPPMVGAFVSEVARQLQGQGPSLSWPLTWIEQRLSEFGQTIRSVVQQESQQQAADQVSMSNSIMSLRFLGTMNWREFVETMSEADKVLREDPADIYVRMDFATRDRYRHIIEKIAKKSSLSESEVARMAILLARKACLQKSSQDRSAHVGFYLIDKGLPELEKLAKATLSPYEILSRFGRRVPLLFYLGSIFLSTFTFTFFLLAEIRGDGADSWMLAVIALLLMICTSHLAIAFINWFSTLLVVPHPLPRMDFSRGIPPECRTLVAVPTMLLSERSVSGILEALEIRFLPTRDDHLRFALLTDFRDSAPETLPDDETLLEMARCGIEELNEKYKNSKGDIFFLFHRSRLWNARENIWMGYERKRGKLTALNAFLRGRTTGLRKSFFSHRRDTSELLNIKYFITLERTRNCPATQPGNSWEPWPIL